MRKILLSVLLSSAFNVAGEEMQVRISPEQIDNLAIEVGGMTPSQYVPLLSAPAKVVVPADHEVLLSAPQPGLLTQLQVNIGDRVEKGQALAQIHSPELVTLQQQYLTANSELNLASLSQNRDKKLFQEGVIAQRRWQETQAMYSSKAAVASESKQLLNIAGMASPEIEKLAKTHHLTTLLNVRSPIKGVVLERLATLGTRLDMQAPLYRIADLSELWLEINIPQERAQSIHIGDKVQIPSTDNLAKITLLGQNVDTVNQTISARAVIQRGSGNIRVGQQFNVQIMHSGPEASFRVPNSAIAQNGGHSYIFVRNPEGFSVNEVKIVGKEAQDSLISGDIDGSEQIAVTGAVALKANWLGLGGDE